MYVLKCTKCKRKHIPYVDKCFCGGRYSLFKV